MEKSTPLWCEDCRFVSFETGLGKPMLTLNDPNGFKNSTNVYSIHLELRMALPFQISTGKWKYVNPCLDFLGIPDQRTAYVKRQARPRWTYVRRSSVTPDLIMAAAMVWNNSMNPIFTENEIFVWIPKNISELIANIKTAHAKYNCHPSLQSLVLRLSLFHWGQNGCEAVAAKPTQISRTMSMCHAASTLVSHRIPVYLLTKSTWIWLWFLSVLPFCT